MENIESLESLDPQYRTGIKSVDTEKWVSIDSSSGNEVSTFQGIKFLRFQGFRVLTFLEIQGDNTKIAIKVSGFQSI
jgi:hypothetical protein